MTIAFVSLGLLGCGSDDPRDSWDVAVYPLRHSSALELPDSELVVVDRGVVCVEEDGRYLSDADKTGIYLRSRTGDVVKRLLKAGSSVDASATGRLLATTNGSLFIYVVSTEEMERVFEPNAYFPRWNAAGTKIVFDSNAHGNYGVWVYDLASKVSRELVQNARMPDWDAWNEGVICVSWPDSGKASELIACDETGAFRERLTFDNSVDLYPDVSSDGRLVLFESQAPNEDKPQLWVLDRVMQTRRQLTTEGGLRPRWSPDGRRIVYIGLPINHEVSEGGTCCVIDFESGAKTLVVPGWPRECPG